MDLIVTGAQTAALGDQIFRCATGRKGFCPADERKEGSETTPIGRWTMLEVLYRPDRIARKDIETGLPVRPLAPNDGWCDDEKDPNYNKYVSLPYPASAEKLWRDDPLYDLVVVLDHNTNPIVPGKGSCIFFHVARDNYDGTAGCISLSREDMLTVLRHAKKGDAVLISPQP
ncbi:MAG: L,D-transpeptidase family protein [Alphaproteobacteria bacterium]|nr:L,D-transpeptidase family protein [Alphaproteobacteria bacterium]